MRARPAVLAVPLLLGPGVLAMFSGGYGDTARTAAGGLARLLPPLLATAPVLGLVLYLTFSRGALGALGAGLGVLLALAPTRAQLRAALVVVAAAALPALATLGLPAVARAG